MKAKLVTAIALFGILITAGACTAANANNAPDQATVEVSIDELMSQKHIEKQVEVVVGGTLKVTMGSNPSTGFSWTEQSQIVDGNILEQTDHEFISPDTDIPGAAGKDVWTFKALTKGATTISMEYSRPWEGGEKGEWTFELTVDVQ